MTATSFHQTSGIDNRCRRNLDEKTMTDYHRRRMHPRHSTWMIILTCLSNTHVVPAFSSTLSLITSPSRGGSSLTRKIAGGTIRGGVYTFHLPVANEEPLGIWRICDGYVGRRSVLGFWQLWSWSEAGNHQSAGDSNGTSGNIQGARWPRVVGAVINSHRYISTWMILSQYMFLLLYAEEITVRVGPRGS